MLGRTHPRQDHQCLWVAARYGVSNRKSVQMIGETERHTEPPLTTLELAERIQIIHRQLERPFRVHLDDTLSNFYLGLRLDKARQLLH